MVIGLRAPTQVGTQEIETDADADGELVVAVYPNPAAGDATIDVNQPASGRLTVSIFDLLGRRHQVVVDRDVAEGGHRFRLAAAGLAPGVYFARVGSGESVVSRMFVVAR